MAAKKEDTEKIDLSDKSPEEQECIIRELQDMAEKNARLKCGRPITCSRCLKAMLPHGLCAKLCPSNFLN